jgi:hypothetical protein
MLVIYYEYQLKNADVKVSRLLPEASWIQSNLTFMSKMDALIAAAEDRKIAFHEERTARPQNNSHHNSLPGTDALPSSSLPGADVLPSSSLDGTDALPSGSLPGTDALVPSSSLPGRKALPKMASNLKTVFVKEGTLSKDPQKKKKKKRQQQSNSYSYTPSGSLSPTGYSGGYEYGMCDKDCGWCGNCSENFDWSRI